MRQPDLTIGPKDNPQTQRWHLWKWRGVQLALHKWSRSDDDRALHDHRGHNVSIILWRGYWEIIGELGINAEGKRNVVKKRRVWRRCWVPYFRNEATPHRVELHDNRPVWTIWLRFTSRRNWGFWCKRGWVPQQDYLAERDYSIPGSTSTVGKGCDD